MKRYKYLFIAPVFLLCASCAKEARDTETGEVRIVAAAASDKTTLNDGGSTVFWEPGDEMSVFYNEVNLHFVSLNKQQTRTAVFACTRNIVIATNEDGLNSGLIGLYPYNGDAWCEDGTVVTRLSPSQLGVAGSFGSGYSIAMAQSNTDNLAFYNVCGGIRFTLTTSGITSVTLTGNDNEAVAGDFAARFEDGLPVVQSVSAPCSSIRLTLPDGASFETGKWYYIVALPVNFSKGFTLRFESATQFGEKVTTKDLTVSRGVFGSLANVDSGVEFHNFGGKSEWTIEGEDNAGRIIDDDMLSYWTASSATLPVSLTIDMKIARGLDRFYFNQAYCQPEGTSAVKKMKIEYSNDKTGWATVVNERELAVDNCYTQGLLFDSGLVSARYYRITITEAAVPGCSVQLAEVNFGSDSWTSGDSIMWFPGLTNNDPSAGFKWHGTDPIGWNRWFTLDDWTHENSNGMTFDTAQPFQYTPNGTPVLFAGLGTADLTNAKLFQTRYLLPGHYVLGVASVHADNLQWIKAYLNAARGSTLTAYDILSSNPFADSNCLAHHLIGSGDFNGDNTHKWTWIAFDLKEAGNVSVGFVCKTTVDALSQWPYVQYYWNGVTLVQQGLICE